MSFAWIWLVQSELKIEVLAPSITQWVHVGFWNLNVSYWNLNVGYWNLNGCSSSWQRCLQRSWHRKLHAQEQKAACNNVAKRIRFFSDLRDAQFGFQDFKEADNDDEERRRFCADLRRLQQRNKCSNATCEDICSTFAKYISVHDFII